MKFYIYSELKSGSWGGGNQFLKALKSQLISMGVYAESLRSTDVIIFNGYQELSGIFKNWFFHHKQKRVYRLGPILSLHRIGLRWRLVDFVVVMFASLFSDLVVFQSKWSYEKALKFGLMSKKKYAIIGNAVDDSIFYPKEFQDKKNKDKTKLIYTSWSSNMKKGFNYLKFLDNNLDFDKL
jgi:hypothetical protein